MFITRGTPNSAARSLLAAAGRDPAQHTILEENLATLLSHFDDEFVRSLEDVPAERRLEALNGCYGHGPVHMALKISREIRQKPYPDQAVHQRLEQLQTEVQRTVKTVLEENTGFPCRFYVAGSLLKGRFGANSDLDLLVAAGPEWMQKNFWQVGRQEDVSIQCLQGSDEEQAKKVESFGKTLEVKPEQLVQPGFLHGLWRQGLASKGLVVQPDGHLQATGPVEREREPDHRWGIGGMV